jgi:hypothetical protein
MGLAAGRCCSGTARLRSSNCEVCADEYRPLSAVAVRHQPACEIEAGGNVFGLEHGILAEYFLVTLSRAKKFKHSLHRDAHPADRGPAVADGGVDGDSVLDGTYHNINIAFR